MTVTFQNGRIVDGVEQILSKEDAFGKQVFIIKTRDNQIICFASELWKVDYTAYKSM